MEAGRRQIKVYGITYGALTPNQELIDAGKAEAAKILSTLATKTNHYGVGFLGIHEGRTSNFVFMDWWADENELHHHVLISPKDDPAHFTYATPTGLIACVWDLALMAFESEAWVECFLKGEGDERVNGYLLKRVKEDV